MTIAWKSVRRVSTDGAVVSADLDNSSNHSNELLNALGWQVSNPLARQSFEDRSGEGFLTIGAHVRVSRS